MFNPLPEEFIGSVVRRCQENTLQNTPIKIKDFTVIRDTNKTIKYPAALEGTHVKKDILYNNTLYPLAIALKKSFSQGIVFTPIRRWKICVECVREDIEQFGVAYIHRRNTFHGVQLCSEHAVDLLEKCPTCHISIALHSNRKFLNCSDRYEIRPEKFGQTSRHLFSKFLFHLIKNSVGESIHEDAEIMIILEVAVNGFKDRKNIIDFERLLLERKRILNTTCERPIREIQNLPFGVLAEMAFLGFKTGENYLRVMSDKNALSEISSRYWKT